MSLMQTFFLCHTVLVFRTRSSTLCNYILFSVIFVLMASITHSLNDVSYSLHGKLQCSKWNLLTRIKAMYSGQVSKGQGERDGREQRR